jgi:dehydrogenase E1 component
MSKKKAAYENPLIPNARLKQMYRAILRTHLLGQSFPPAQRALTAAREAALVSTSIDLTPRDIVLDAFSTPVLDFLRGSELRRIEIKDRAPHPREAWVGSKLFRRLRADAGSPLRLSPPSDPAARLHAAVGAAAALKSSAAAAKSESSPDSAVVLCVSIAGEVPVDIWKSALSHSAQYDLPILFLMLPASESARIARHSSKPLDLRGIAHRAGVPAIPVDAADPVALYRVAQESIGHARIGGGPALIECVAFPAAISRNPAAIAHAALAHLAEYILSRGIATPAWMDREASSFAAQIRTTKSASK